MPPSGSDLDRRLPLTKDCRRHPLEDISELQLQDGLSSGHKPDSPAQTDVADSCRVAECLKVSSPPLTIAE